MRSVKRSIRSVTQIGGTQLTTLDSQSLFVLIHSIPSMTSSEVSSQQAMQVYNFPLQGPTLTRWSSETVHEDTSYGADGILTEAVTVSSANI